MSTYEGQIATGYAGRNVGHVFRMDPPPELEAIRQDLLRMNVDFDKAFGKILQAVATGAKNWVRGRMYGHIRMRTGWLREHVYGVRRSPSHYVVAAPRHIAEPLEKGTTIRPNPKSGKPMLAWWNGVFWVKKNEVVIPARHWFTRAYSGYEDSQEFKEYLDMGIRKVLKKYNLDDGGTA